VYAAIYPYANAVLPVGAAETLFMKYEYLLPLLKLLYASFSEFFEFKYHDCIQHAMENTICLQQ
jgi:hypothetical protein